MDNFSWQDIEASGAPPSWWISPHPWYDPTQNMEQNEANLREWQVGMYTASSARCSNCRRNRDRKRVKDGYSRVFVDTKSCLNCETCGWRWIPESPDEYRMRP